MSETLKFNEYCRTKLGEIFKVVRINELDRNIVYDKHGARYYRDEIIKHSKNIIDLIEVGDYVNGILITGKEGTLLYTDIKGIDNSGYHIPISQYEENIKSIVTKEQFKSVIYELEEGK